jgi:hypothetical protein
MSAAGKGAKKKNDKTDKNQKKEETIEEFEECVGEGKFVYPNKAVYIGQYRQLKTGQKIKEGKGKLYMPGAKILNQKGKENKSQNSEELIGCEYYEGEWKDDKMDGYGVYLYSNGDKYEGYWSMGSQNGNGKYIFTDGRSYEGEWKMQKMHGTGFFSCLDKYANFNGEFREGKFLTKNQEELKEEKRLIKIYEVLNSVPKNFQKTWEEVCATDPKTVNDVLITYFATQETMGKFFNNVQFPVFDDYKPKYWMDSVKWVFEEEHEKPGAKKGKEEEENPIDKLKVNLPKTSDDTIVLEKGSLLCPQLQNDLDNGQVVELIATVKDRCVKLVLGYNFDLKRWLIVFFEDNKAPAKEVKKKK